MKKILMGHEAIAYGAIAAGVDVVTGYPGTPSTETLETVAKLKQNGYADNVYVEWSVNEKSALEVAAGAAYSGLRCMVTMKQVGLNVASDPLMSLAYIGVKGGMVILVADDPGPISSQTEQDTRHFAQFAKLPVFDPTSPEEAYEMIADAFDFSEKYSTPVIFRPTTRVCHAYAAIELKEEKFAHIAEGFVKDTSKWVIFPRTSYLNHLKIEERNRQLKDILSDYKYNSVEPAQGRLGIAASGVSYSYAKEAMQTDGIIAPIMKIATAHPFPEKLAAEFLRTLDEVLVYEELDPVVEKELIYVCYKYNLNVKIKGKLTGNVPDAGENSTDAARMIFADYFGTKKPDIPQAPDIKMPVRPPMLCAGCPHRASFYAVKKAMKGRKAVFAGDIGCYTLGNAKPLDMVDTCLCMGAGITVAQGIKHSDPDTVCFSFTGDSTFFHTGIPGIVNAVYNGTKIVSVILDNSTTAMTGHQPNPNTGKRAAGEIAEVISIEKMLEAAGVKYIQTVNPFDLEDAVAAVRRAADFDGVSAIIFRAPCIALFKPEKLYTVDKGKCIGCKKCAKEIGCPALIKNGNKVEIDSTLCYGCGLCEKVCPTGAISGKGGKIGV